MNYERLDFTFLESVVKLAGGVFERERLEMGEGGFHGGYLRRFTLLAERRVRIWVMAISLKLPQTLRCGQALADKHGVETFEIGEDDELLNRRVVADIALGVGMGVAPLRGGLAKESDVEQVGFAGVGVDAVIDLRESALKVPAELEAVVFVVFEALEFLDEVELELDGDP